MDNELFPPALDVTGISTLPEPDEFTVRVKEESFDPSAKELILRLIENSVQLAELKKKEKEQQELLFLEE